MASLKSKGFFAPKFTPGDGVGVVIVDSIALSANPSASDTIDFVIPAGTEVSDVQIQATDMDTNGTPTFAFSVGYAPLEANSIYSADATYFAAAGQTTFRTGGRLRCDFVPKKFEEDVILRLTVGTAAATFAAGTVYAIVTGAARGVR